jgi:hypothetical protein
MKYRQVHMRQIASVRCIHQINGGAAEVEIREKYYSALQINSPPNTFYVPANISICLYISQLILLQDRDSFQSHPYYRDSWDLEFSLVDIPET